MSIDFDADTADEGPGPPADLDDIAAELVAQARAEGVSLTGEGGLLFGLIGRVLQGALDVEMTEHLGYAPHALEGRGSGNSRNGHYAETVRTEIGDVRIDVPRDRNGSFEPVTVPVGQRRLSGLDDVVISLYAKGLTTGDIVAHLEDIYGTVMDRSTISRITDRIAADMEAWQSRPLDAIYPVILIDGIRIKIRDGHVSNRTVYVAMGINLDGERDILGLWVGPTGGESAKYWMGPLTELKTRGVADVLILCCDGLKGLPDAARAVWGQVEVQLCVVHLVRKELRYASKKHWPKITKALKAIDTRMKARLVVAAIEMAVARRGDVAGCIFHSDRGSQFRARKVHRALAHHGMVGSMGQVGSAGDNAAMESFFAGRRQREPFGCGGRSQVFGFEEPDSLIT